MPSLLAFFNPGPMDIVIIGVIILLLFGNRLPSVMRSLGRGVVEFKKGVSGEDDDEDREHDEKGSRDKDHRDKDHRDKDHRDKDHDKDRDEKDHKEQKSS